MIFLLRLAGGVIDGLGAAALLFILAGVVCLIEHKRGRK